MHKKLLSILLLSFVFFGCKKEEDLSLNTERLLTGKWKSTLTMDVIHDMATGNEVDHVNYLHGMGTELTLDGKGTANSYDPAFNNTFTHAYSVRVNNQQQYLTTQLVGLDVTEYQIIGLDATHMRLKGKVLSNVNVTFPDGKNHLAYYERTEYFEKQ
ncbi:hypothetical protein FFF34_008915 [Inquilinus sp. KBS0705]|nr:hypothetical protein FFF34_008915 [Inquilinus sp. KBS0705]